MTKEQIEEYFRNIQGINEAKIVFKKLAKKLHPDIGGSNAEFKILNKVYNDILENKIYFSNESKIDLELEKIISQILHYEDLMILIIGSFIWIEGNTKPIKEKLKDLGFKWARKKKMWFYGEMKTRNHKEKSLDEIKSKYKCQTIKTNKQNKITG